MAEKYDFSGYATKNDLQCADGRTIRKDAFIDCDGLTVPIVYGHDHKSIDQVLGHGLLKNVEDGVRIYGTFNNTPAGQAAKESVRNGDIKHLSIYANNLKQVGKDVVHGMIREVSLVLAGANPGAVIDYPVLAHSGEEVYDEAIMYLPDDEELVVQHAEKDTKEEPEEKEKKEVASEEKKDKTVEDVFNTLTEEQKTVVYALIGAALEEKEEAKHSDEDGDDFYDEEGDENVMKHNVFDTDERNANFLTHADEEAILEIAKNSSVGSFQEALAIFADQNELQHDAVSSGFNQTGTPYNVTTMFPDYKEVHGNMPELITSDQGWIGTVMSKVHKSPISRIRTSQVDIRNIEGNHDDLRARGYKKGKQKSQTGNFTLLRRTTDPQTVYVKSALHRDDIIDITDFDYVQYLYNIDRMNLNEELATAIMLGDGRSDASDDKIFPDKIRPIWTDDDLYTIHYDIDFDAAREELQGSETDSYFGDNYVKAEAMVNACLYSRERFKGTGTPDMYMTPHDLNVMLLARDRNGRRIYSSKAELASALNVGNIYTCEQFENRTRTVTVDGTQKTKKLHCLIVNLADYSLGATKGGEITHFTQFDIDFNQQKSLLETRCSGALTRVWSAIAIEEDVTA